MKKLSALILAALCLFSFAACTKESGVETREDESMNMHDIEDGEIVKAKVSVANMTDKDAVSLLTRKSGTKEWSQNLLLQDYLHKNKAVEITYNKHETNVYDLRLVFEDGSYEDYPEIDFDKVKSMVYLSSEQ